MSRRFASARIARLPDGPGMARMAVASGHLSRSARAPASTSWRHRRELSTIGASAKIDTPAALKERPRSQRSFSTSIEEPSREAVLGFPLVFRPMPDRVRRPAQHPIAMANRRWPRPRKVFGGLPSAVPAIDPNRMELRSSRPCRLRRSRRHPGSCGHKRDFLDVAQSRGRHPPKRF